MLVIVHKVQVGHDFKKCVLTSAEKERTAYIQEKVSQADTALQGRLRELASNLGMSVANYEIYVQQNNAIAAEAERARLLSLVKVGEEQFLARIRQEEADWAAERDLKTKEAEARIRADEKDRKADRKRKRKEEEAKIRADEDERKARLVRQEMDARHRAEIDKMREEGKQKTDILEAENRMLREKIELEAKLRDKTAAKEAKRTQKVKDKEQKRAHKHDEWEAGRKIKFSDDTRIFAIHRRIDKLHKKIMKKQERIEEIRSKYHVGYADGFLYGGSITNEVDRVEFFSLILFG